MDNPKKDKILPKALDIFLRYGFKRTTMNDIAEASGISRPALYLIFKGKEDVFKAVYEQWVKDTLADVKRAIAQLKDPEEKLRAAFELWTVLPFERMQASSEAAELLESTFGFAQDSVNQGYVSFEKILVPVLKSHATFRSGRAKVSAEKTARLLSGAARGYKIISKDVRELRSLIKELLVLVLHD